MKGLVPSFPERRTWRLGLCAPAVSFLAFQDMFHDTNFVFLFLSCLAGQCVAL
jgi:hypothetical protein